MKTFTIWAKGYCATGTDGKFTEPHYHGSAVANTFKEACMLLIDKDDKFFDSEHLTYYGCTLYNKDEREVSSDCIK